MTVDTAPPAEQGSPAEHGSGVRRTGGGPAAWIRRLLVLAVVAGALYQVSTQWSEVSRTLLALPWYSVVLSSLAAFAGIWLGPLMWRAVLASLGSPIRVRDASMIFLVGQLGKYVPGSVWALVLQMELGKAVGLTRLRSFTSSIVTTGLGAVASLVVGLLALPVIVDGNRELLWIFVLLPFGLVMLHPRPLNRCVSLGLRLLRRGQLPQPLTGGAIVRVTALGFASFGLFGAHLWLLAGAVGSADLELLVLCTGTMALAMMAGLLAFFLPSGIGAREVVIVAALLTVLPSGQALALAVASRVVFTVVDLASAGGAALLARRRATPGAVPA